MEESMKKKYVEGGDKEILYSKAIKAGKRIYYLDVKRNLKDDLFVAVTESKKIQSKDNMQVSFEKHKIFLYREDFDKFMEGMQEVIGFIKESNLKKGQMKEDDSDDESLEDGVEQIDSDEIRLNIGSTKN